jgi:hypothetical protein
MTDDQLLRYSRHILLPEVGIDGQEKLAAASVLVVGAGGLGSPAAYYLASAGIGRLVLADGDTVDLTNLQRQILHATAAIGTPKVVSGRDTLHRINPECHIVPLAERLENSRLAEEIAAADVVLDCSDNFATRHAINRTCVAQKKTARIGCGDPLRRAGGSIRPAQCRGTLLSLPVSRGRRGRGNPLRRDGRIRAADRHHRLGSGSGSAETDHWLRRGAHRPAAVARRTGNALARNQGAARSGVCGVRGSASGSK